MYDSTWLSLHVDIRTVDLPRMGGVFPAETHASISKKIKR